MPELEGKPIGKVSHYFGKIGVAIIELSDTLKVGEKIKIVGKDGSFEQAVESMELDRKKIQEAKAGESVGLKVIQKTKEEAPVFKI
jgi:translation elongation factor EF-Tu-like GTPase